MCLSIFCITVSFILEAKKGTWSSNLSVVGCKFVFHWSNFGFSEKKVSMFSISIYYIDVCSGAACFTRSVRKYMQFYFLCFSCIFAFTLIGKINSHGLNVELIMLSVPLLVLGICLLTALKDNIGIGILRYGRSFQ